MLREEAAKLLNQKQKEKFLSTDANNVSTKLSEVIKTYQTQYQNETNISKKLKIADDLKRAKLYLEKVKSPEYKKWIGEIKSSNPLTSPDIFGGSSWKGEFAKDKLVNPLATRFEDLNNVSWNDILEFTNKNHSLIKGTDYQKTNFIGQNINSPLQVYDAVSSAYAPQSNSVKTLKQNAYFLFKN